MDIISDIRKRAALPYRRVALPERTDERVLKAASFLSEEKIAQIILTGTRQGILHTAEAKGVELPDNVEFIDPENFSHIDYFAENLFERRKQKGMTREEARSVLIDNPLYFGASLVANGAADACVAGSIATTGEIVRTALQVIGLRKGIDTVSSSFLMVMPDGKAFTYADCGVVPCPDKHELADIAIESARTHQLLTGQYPKVALLSFSTKGSAQHEKAELVRQAVEIIREKAGNLDVDGELQFDAAFVPEVAKMKAPNSLVAGDANVFIFPNLDAGNIAYKITERLAGASATGPILQGLARPMMDLSRGCTWQDIVNAVCVAVILGENYY